MMRTGIMKGLRHGVAAVAVLAAWSAPAQAQAQDGTQKADEQPAPQRPKGQVEATSSDEAIVVTGLRDVAATLGQIKRQNPQIVDSLTQNEIERLPDRSLAEVLDRVVGVSSDRGFATSQPRTITLRGFDSRYNSMNVDGNVVWNSSRNNRGTQLDVFPAAVINQIDVFKTVSTAMDANSIGGHLELRTLRAFDGGTNTYFRARASAGIYEQDDLPEEGQPSFQMDAVGKFTFGTDRNFGVVLGAEFQQHEFFDVLNETTAYSAINGVDVVNGNAFGGIFQTRQERLALYGKLEARSSDQYYGFISVSYFGDDLHQTFNRGGPFITATRVTDAAPGRGTFTGATLEQFFEDYRLNRETVLLGSGFDYRVGENGSINLRAAYTRYDHDEKLFRSERFQLGGLSGTYDFTETGPGLAFSEASQTLIGDPARYLSRTNRAAFDLLIPHIDDVFNASADFKLNTQASARGFGIEGGIFWRRLERRFDQTTNNFTIPTGTILPLSQVLAARTADRPLTGFGPAFIDPDAYLAVLAARAVASVATNDTNDYTVKEDVLAGHLAATFTTDTLRLSAGFRIERTDLTNGTSSVVSGVTAPVTRQSDYTEFLPNVQAIWDPLPGLKLRLAYTETLARPDFVDFAPGQTITINAQGVEVITGTNPFLAPRTARGYDASAEYYFARNGFVALGVFRKDLDNETFRQRQDTTDANGVLTRIETIPLNTGSAQLTGLEASFVVNRMAFLPGPLANLGVNLNYTLLDGDWNVVFTDGSTRTVDGLRNQPRWLGNIAVNYNDDRLSGSVAWRLRGRTFTGQFGATVADDLYVDEYTRLDAQIAYRVTGNVQVFAEGRNLTDEYWIEQSGVSQSALRTATSPGRTYWFGIRAKY
jgi:iron complex outermembrane recepter protein